MTKSTPAYQDFQTLVCPYSKPEINFCIRTLVQTGVDPDDVSFKLFSLADKAIANGEYDSHYDANLTQIVLDFLSREDKFFDKVAAELDKRLQCGNLREKMAFKESAEVDLQSYGSPILKAKLYYFDKAIYDSLVEKGLHSEFLKLSFANPLKHFLECCEPIEF